MRTVISALLLVLVYTNSSTAQFFIDEFDDGSTSDGRPVNWVPLAPFDGGQHVVQDNSYVLRPDSNSDFENASYSEIDVIVEDLSYGEVSLRSEVQLLGPNTDYWIGVFGRRTLDESGNDAGIWGAVRQNGGLQVGVFNDSLNMEMRWTGNYEPFESLWQNSVNIQLDVLADSAALTVWRSDTAKPTSPQIVIPDLPDYVPAEGQVGMFTVQTINVQTEQVAFRHFEAAQIPEPSALTLAVMGLATICGRHRRRRAADSSWRTISRVTTLRPHESHLR